MNGVHFIMQNKLFGLTAAIALAAVLTSAAQAQNGAVRVKSSSAVEKSSTDANGNKKVTLTSTNFVVPGDVVLFTHDYENTGSQPATGFLINRPLSHQVQFVGSTDANIVVSVDGGRTYGPLASMKVAGRAATPADVTNLRWTFTQPIAPGEKGKVSFRGMLK